MKMARAFTLVELLVAVTIIVSTAAQGGIHLKKFSARFDQFNIIKGVGHLFGGVADQRQRCAPRHQPADVGGELVSHRDSHGSVHVRGGVRGAVTQIDDPLPGIDART